MRVSPCFSPPPSQSGSSRSRNGARRVTRPQSRKLPRAGPWTRPPKADAAAVKADAQRLGAQALLENRLDLSLLLARAGDKLDPSVATKGYLLADLLRSPAAIGVAYGDGGRLFNAALSPDDRMLALGRRGRNGHLRRYRDPRAARTADPGLRAARTGQRPRVRPRRPLDRDDGGGDQLPRAGRASRSRTRSRSPAKGGSRRMPRTRTTAACWPSSRAPSDPSAPASKELGRGGGRAPQGDDGQPTGVSMPIGEQHGPVSSISRPTGTSPSRPGTRPHHGVGPRDRTTAPQLSARRGVRASPDGKTAAIGDLDGAVTLLDLETGDTRRLGAATRQDVGPASARTARRSSPPATMRRSSSGTSRPARSARS